MPYSESQKRATIKWMADNYERIYLSVPKGMKQKIKEVATAQGYKSSREFIIATLTEAIKKQTS